MLKDGTQSPDPHPPETYGPTPQDSASHGIREVIRFGATERAFHWGFAIPFLGLLVSGLPLSFPILRSWITGYSPQIGVRLHLVCGVAWLVIPPLVVIFGNRRALATVVSDLFVVAWKELSWLAQLPRWLAGLSCEMKGVGRFNAGQKLNGLLVAVTSILFAITGIILWIVWQSPAPGWMSGPLSGALVGWCRRLHYLLTLLIVLPLVGHIALATVHPRTSESLRGMLFGTVSADWARAHHPEWYKKTCQETSARVEQR